MFHCCICYVYHSLHDKASLRVCVWSQNMISNKACMCCRLKWISGQNDLKLVWFVFPLFYSHYHKTETKENKLQTSFKLFWPEIHFNLQHMFHTLFRLEVVNFTSLAYTSLRQHPVRLTKVLKQIQTTVQLQNVSNTVLGIWSIFLYTFKMEKIK